MNRFFYPAALLISVVILILTGCATTKEQCGAGHTQRLFAFNSFSAANFELYSNGGDDAGYVKYSAAYHVVNGRAVFNYLIGLDKVCIFSDVTVYSTLNTLVNNPEFADTLIIKAPGFSSQVVTVINPSNMVYDRDEIYTFDANSANPAQMLINNKLSFPTGGSWQADSAYFFSNIGAYSFGGTFTLYQE
jgi:hypothetical protein